MPAATGRNERAELHRQIWAIADDPSKIAYVKSAAKALGVKIVVKGDIKG